MNNLKIIRNSAIILSLALGLSNCMMGDDMMGRHDQAPQPPMMKTVPNHEMHKGQAKTMAKKSTDAPAQKSAPGPKRAAAPQIPVIQ
jgi:hypothetical protein